MGRVVTARSGVSFFSSLFDFYVLSSRICSLIRKNTRGKISLELAHRKFAVLLINISKRKTDTRVVPDEKDARAKIIKFLVISIISWNNIVPSRKNNI